MNLPIKTSAISNPIARTTLALAFYGCLLTGPSALGGWAPLSTLAPDNIELMLLLPDGTVMGASAYTTNGSYGKTWYRLTPDNTGHYTAGLWTARATATYTRLWCSTQVLQNGKVFVAGGEYGTGGLTAELYNPGGDNWSPITVPAGVIYTGPSGDAQNSGFRDSVSELLPNGKVMIAPVFPGGTRTTVIYDPVVNSLSQGPAYLASQNEAGWVKLPDTSILTIDKNSTTAERFIPSLNQWIGDTNTPVNIYDPYGVEEGPGFLLPNGKAVFFGGNGHTVIYTPSGTTNIGSWVQGPDIPGGNGMPDAGGCMMVNGKILIAASKIPFGSASSNIFNLPTFFYEYDYTVGTTGSFTPVLSPVGGASDPISSYQALMLALPDGNVLYSDFSRQLYVYSPASGPLPAGKPAISSITPNGNGTYHVTGTRFNGISEGAAYGDDAQMGSNYPLIRLADGNGTFLYQTTFNWSSTGVATGNQLVSTEFFASQSLTPGHPYSLAVVANGISSDPVTFYGPVWVDFNNANPFFLQFGTYDLPYATMAQAVGAVPAGGTINIKTAGHTPETMTLNSAMTITAIGGPATIGE